MKYFGFAVYISFLCGCAAQQLGRPTAAIGGDPSTYDTWPWTAVDDDGATVTLAKSAVYSSFSMVVHSASEQRRDVQTTLPTLVRFSLHEDYLELQQILRSGAAPRVLQRFRVVAQGPHSISFRWDAMGAPSTLVGQSPGPGGQGHPMQLGQNAVAATLSRQSGGLQVTYRSDAGPVMGVDPAVAATLVFTPQLSGSPVLPS